MAAGEAVLWPADVPHGAWADHGHMRAIVVELAGPDDGCVAEVIDGGLALAIEPGGGAAAAPVERGEGSLRGDGPEPLPDPDAGEPH